MDNHKLSFLFTLLICTGYMIDAGNALMTKNKRRLKKEDHLENHPDHGVYVDSLSFKKPWLSDTGKNVRNDWEFLGSSISAQDTHVRLTTAKKNQQGMMYNVNPINMESWEMIVTFRFGGGSRIGGDGMALWLVEKPQTGPVFGGADNWKGLAVFIDTFDNDGQKDSPLVSAWYNDGTISYDTKTDGLLGQSGGCIPAGWTRNPYTNSKLKLVHENGKIDIYVYDTASSNAVKYYPCVEGIPWVVPSGYHLAFSAQTSENTDNHDIFSVKVYNLDPNAETDSKPEIVEEPLADVQPVIVEEVMKRIGEMDKQTNTEVKQNFNRITVPEGANSILHPEIEKPKNNAPELPKTLDDEVQLLADQQREMIEDLIFLSNKFREVNKQQEEQMEKVKQLATQAANTLQVVTDNGLTVDDLSQNVEAEMDVQKIQQEIASIMAAFSAKVDSSSVELQSSLATFIGQINSLEKELVEDINDNSKSFRTWVMRTDETVTQISSQATPVSYWTYLMIGQILIALVVFVPFPQKKKYAPYFFDEKV